MSPLSKNLICDVVRLSSVCYQPNETIKNEYCNKRPYNKDDTSCVFNTLKTCPILYTSDKDCEVLVCEHESKSLIVAFRGTSSTKDILTDLMITREKLSLMNLPENKWPLVHSGFSEQFFSITHKMEESIKSNNSIIFCGHSLGGALASIGSLYYACKYPEKNISCITFGSPRAGNYQFTDYFDRKIGNSLRFVNDNDPVPCVPSRWRFKHVKGLQWFNKNEVEHEIDVSRFYRFLKNTILSLFGFGYNACDDHKCDNYINDVINNY